jgi:hypothetical protein
MKHTIDPAVLLTCCKDCRQYQDNDGTCPGAKLDGWRTTERSPVCFESLPVRTQADANLAELLGMARHSEEALA